MTISRAVIPCTILGCFSSHIQFVILHVNIELQVISIGPASRPPRPEVQDMIEVEISELGINKCAYICILCHDCME